MLLVLDTGSLMIKKDEIIPKCKAVSREALYIMVFIILMQTCELTDDKIVDKLENIDKKISHIEQILEMKKGDWDD